MNKDLHERIEQIKRESGAEKFAYEGCHKIYLVEDEHDIEEAQSYGYDIYPIERLEEVFQDSCPYRFISN